MSVHPRLEKGLQVSEKPTWLSARLVLSHRGRRRGRLLAIVGGLKLLNKALHFQRVAFPVAVTLHGAGAARRFNIDIAEDHPRIDPDRRNVGDMDRVLALADEAGGVLDNGGRRDLNLRGKQVVSRTESTGAKDVARRERPAFSPDDRNQDSDYGDEHNRRDDPGRVEVELIHKRFG